MSDKPFGGRIERVRVYNHVLTAKEMADEYKGVRMRYYSLREIAEIVGIPLAIAAVTCLIVTAVGLMMFYAAGLPVALLLYAIGIGFGATVLVSLCIALWLSLKRDTD